jgi:photosystem II stability/assembly factor-like uncharacterized protein
VSHVPPRGSAVITLAAGEFLYRSANGGKTWAAIAIPRPGPTLSSLSYVSPTVGWMVTGGPFLGGTSQLLRTADAGATWHQVRF